MVIRELIESYTRELKSCGIEAPRVDVEMILAKTLNLRRIDLYTQAEKILSINEESCCREKFDRRKQGEPVAYIVGERDFFDRTFFVNSNVLIPRPESELLVEAVLRWRKGSPVDSLKIADFGVGSGCIGLSIIAERPSSVLYAVDMSESALKVAKENATRLGLSDRVSFFHCRVEEFPHRFIDLELDVVVCNPPYVKRGDPHLDPNVAKFEPSRALFSEEDGFHCLKSWSSIAFDLLTRGGLFLMEMGVGQSLEMERYLKESCGFTQIELLKDYSGIERVIQAQKG